MRYTERKGLRILESDFGYLIYNKTNDSYSNKVYLGKFASLDDFEEVEDKEVNKLLIEKINNIDKRIDGIESNNIDLISILEDAINE